jgi:hypothetical protein
MRSQPQRLRIFAFRCASARPYSDAPARGGNIGPPDAHGRIADAMRRIMLFRSSKPILGKALIEEVSQNAPGDRHLPPSIDSVVRELLN